MGLTQISNHAGNLKSLYLSEQITQFILAEINSISCKYAVHDETFVFLLTSFGVNMYLMCFHTVFMTYSSTGAGNFTLS